MCSNADILKVVYLIKIVVTAIQVAVPIILIVTISLDFAKGMKDAKAPSEMLANCRYRLIAAVVIFAIPLLVKIILTVMGNSTFFSACWNNADSSSLTMKPVYVQPPVQDDSSSSSSSSSSSGTSNKNSEYTDANSHKNSINGIRYMLYNQADPRWGKVKYSNGKTIAEIGCLLTAMSVVSSSANSKVTPLYAFETKANNYYMTNAIPKLAGSGNFTCKVGSITHDGIVNQLKKGSVAIIMVKAASSFTSSQHYMALIDVTSDGKQIYVGNSYGSGSGSGRSGWFNSKTVLTDVHEYVYCVPSQALIDKFN